MLSDAELRAQLPYVLTDTNFDFLGQRYEGKVRDNYSHGEIRFLVTSDRLSCFDVVVTTIPFKGQVLNELAWRWFKQTADIIPNHVVDVPDPNVMVVRSCEILPVEVIVRAYLTGSAWRDYQEGQEISGIKLPPGLRASEQLPEVIITPSTKAARGSHDEPISEAEIVKRGLVAPKTWQQVRESALALFKKGSEGAAKQGLILVDTKYEFGIRGGRLILADEIHTLDSSRYWIASSYRQRFEAGAAPEMLDKEPMRQWLLSQGYKGSGEIPVFTAEHRVAIARHYLDSFEKISGVTFEGQVGPIPSRIEQNLRNYIKEKGC